MSSSFLSTNFVPRLYSQQPSYPGSAGSLTSKETHSDALGSEMV